MKERKIFLTAYWKHLLFFNYVVDPAILKPYLPAGTTLDFYNNRCYISLVGFHFGDTKLRGIPIPFYQNFEEFNLRFYVRCKDGADWKRGVVFVKEIVPRRMICYTARLLYGEHYYYYPMKHSSKATDDALNISYEWKVGSEWNYIKAVASKVPEPLDDETEEAFITEHYWGYTKLNEHQTSEYQVSHPRWKIHQVHSYDSCVNAARLYSKTFVPYLQQQPSSVFVAAGSPVEVKTRKLLHI